MSGEIDSEYPKAPKCPSCGDEKLIVEKRPDGDVRCGACGWNGKYSLCFANSKPKQKTLEELLIEFEEFRHSTEDIKQLTDALRTAMEYFKTEMINRGGEESYHESEAAVMRALEGK